MDFINLIEIKIKNLPNKGWYGRFKNINLRNKESFIKSLLRKCSSSSNFGNIEWIEKFGYLDEKFRKYKRIKKYSRSCCDEKKANWKILRHHIEIKIRLKIKRY